MASPGFASRRPTRALPYLVGLLLVLVAAALAWHGWSFYRLPLDERVEHHSYQLLRPAGLVGNGLGYAAALLVFANLSYLARRKQLFHFGTMQTWLGVHVFTGLLAAILAAYHSAFQLRTPIARVTAVSLGVVVLTGVIGRVLHVLLARIERNLLAPAAGALDAAVPGSARLVAEAAAAHPLTELAANASMIRTLAALPRWGAEARWRSEAIGLVLAGHGPLERARQQDEARIAPLIAAVERAAAAEVRAIRSVALLRSWRSFHRLFALLMLLLVALHAGVAWYYGYRWVFG